MSRVRTAGSATDDGPGEAVPCVAVACSGGRDSVALLHAVLRVAATAGWRVVALHVHHGLSAQADGWVERLAAQVEAWRAAGLPAALDVTRLATRPPRAASVEAWARKERYRALARMARAAGADVVLLAHHRRDQAETLLLQALRGGGLAGLAAMPRAVERDGLTWLRPWLDRPREDIERYVAAHGLRWVDDDSNDDPRYARNRLRLAVWPALTAAFPQAEAALADAARWAAEAHRALDELAARDLADLADLDLAGLDAAAIDPVGRGPVADGPALPSGARAGLPQSAPPSSSEGAAGASPSASPDALPIPPWRALSDARRSLALRTWLRRRLAAAPPASLVLRLLAELPLSRGGRWPAPGGELRLYRGRLRWYASTPGMPRTAPRAHAVDDAGAARVGGAAPATARPAAAPETTRLPLSRAGRYRVPGWAGCLRVTRVREGGVPLASLCELELRPRRGGEDFQAGAGRPPRSLKKQFQAAGVPAWQRDGPLMYVRERLVAVPGLGIDARAVGRAGEAMVTLAWWPDAAGDDAPA